MEHKPARRFSMATAILNILTYGRQQMNIARAAQMEALGLDLDATKQRTRYRAKNKAGARHTVNPAGTKIIRKVARGTALVRHSSSVDKWHLTAKPSRIGRRLGV
jgi:hypothetical protein